MAEETSTLERSASGPWTDLGLTLPLFVAYHLGVVFLPVRNAADWGTRQLMDLADRDLKWYGVLTLAIASVYVGGLIALGRGKALRWQSFVWLMVEAIVYAVAMRFAASYVVGKVALTTAADPAGLFGGIVLSLGAGFYEEIAFRVGLFGVGFKTLTVLFSMGPWQKAFAQIGWSLAAALLFSLWHYLGPLADPLEMRSFVFRWTCGLVFTLIYRFRGFAPAVWTHALYDIWVMV
jgi:hypothetical protein